MTTNPNLDQAREWANLKRYSWSEGSKAAAEVIQSLPDLPEPHTFPNGEKEWYTLDGWVNLDTDGTITVVYDERDEDDIAAGAEIASGELVFTKPVAARDLVLAFLAATNHAEGVDHADA